MTEPFGINGGVTCDESEHWGYKPLDRNHPSQVYDIHATMLRLLRIEHTRLTVRNNSIDRRLIEEASHESDNDGSV